MHASIMKRNIWYSQHMCRQLVVLAFNTFDAAENAPYTRGRNQCSLPIKPSNYTFTY